MSAPGYFDSGDQAPRPFKFEPGSFPTTVIVEATVVPYTPVAPAKWPSPTPGSVASALDDLAAASEVTSPGANGTVLTSQGPSLPPIWAAPTSPLQTAWSSSGHSGSVGTSWGPISNAFISGFTPVTGAVRVLVTGTFLAGVTHGMMIGVAAVLHGATAPSSADYQQASPVQVPAGANGSNLALCVVYGGQGGPAELTPGTAYDIYAVAITTVSDNITFNSNAAQIEVSDVNEGL